MKNMRTGQPSSILKNPLFWRWVITILAVILFVVLVSQQNWAEIFTLITRIGWGKLALALAALSCSRITVAGRWSALLQISEKKLPFWKSVEITYAGLFSSNFLPTSIGGDVVRLIGATKEGLKSPFVLASLIMDRVVGLTGMVIFMPFGLNNLLRYFERATHNAGLFHPNLISFSFLPASVQLLWQKSIDYVKKFTSSLQCWLTKPTSVLLALLLTFVHMIFLFWTIQIILNGMGEALNLLQIAVIYSLAYIITLFPISIGGLGVQELSITFFFSALGAISQETSTALALLIRLAFMATSLPGIFFVSDLIKENKNIESTESHSTAE